MGSLLRRGAEQGEGVRRSLGARGGGEKQLGRFTPVRSKMRAILFLLFLSSLQVAMGGRLIRLRDTRNSHRERCRKFVFAPDCRGIQSKRSGGGDVSLKMFHPNTRHYLGRG